MLKALIVSTVLLAPFTSFASQIFGAEELEFARVGGAVTQGRVLGHTCLTGDVKTTELPTPKITYRMYSKPKIFRGSTKAIFVIEMSIAQAETAISNLRNGESEKIDKDYFPSHCGEAYLSKITFGNRITYKIDVEQTEALTLPTKTLVESDASTLEQFSTEAADIISKLKTFSGVSLELNPSRPIDSMSPHEIVSTMSAYRAASLSDRTLQSLVEAEGETYPADFIKRVSK